MAATIPVEARKEMEFTGRVAGPCAFVLFGAAGDLTKRKLVPALFNLAQAKLLPENFALIGVSVDDLSVEAFRDQVSEFLPTDNDTAARDWLRQRLSYLRGDFGDANIFSTLRDRLGEIDSKWHTEGNYLFYLATAPKFFAPIVQQ